MPALNGWEFLRLLKAENLFIIDLDSENRWFRYHHLFQQLLRNQLRRHRPPEHIAMLHERAGDWFARNGMFDEAIHHALKAGNASKAAQLVAGHFLRFHGGLLSRATCFRFPAPGCRFINRTNIWSFAGNANPLVQAARPTFPDHCRRAEPKVSGPDGR